MTLNLRFQKAIQRPEKRCINRDSQGRGGWMNELNEISFCNNKIARNPSIHDLNADK